MKPAKEVIRSVRANFAQREIPDVDAEIIVAHVLGIERMDLHRKSYEINGEQLSEIDELVAQRINGVPTQYLVGEAPFRYLTFEVGPGVLIPRPETELLVDAAMVEIERLFSSFNRDTKSAISVLDLGSGSGAIAISIAHEARQRELPVHVVAVEKESDAITWLERNIAKHDVDVRVVKSDVADALLGVRADIVVANPPYVPDEVSLPELVRGNEPATSLFGGPTGIDLPKRFIAAGHRLLKSGGLLILEHYEDHVAELERFMHEGYFEFTSYSDFNNRPRWITARRRG